MSLRRKVDDNSLVQAMDVYDGDGVFSDKHQLILQYLMHAQMAKITDLTKVHGKIFNNVENLNDTLSVITNKINPLKMDIKRVLCEHTGVTYYSLIHTTEESFFPQCCLFTKSQAEFLKKVISEIVLSPNGRIGKIQALNSCKTLSKSEAEVTIGQFIKEKLLIETERNELCMSALTIVEFQPFFSSCFADDLFTCDLCKQLVFLGKICDGCEEKFHLHCVSKWLGGNRYECPNCKQGWTDLKQADTE